MPMWEGLGKLSCGLQKTPWTVLALFSPLKQCWVRGPLPGTILKVYLQSDGQKPQQEHSILRR